jgi:hypothetical protein
MCANAVGECPYRRSENVAGRFVFPPVVIRSSAGASRSTARGLPRRLALSFEDEASRDVVIAGKTNPLLLHERARHDVLMKRIDAVVAVAR